MIGESLEKHHTCPTIDHFADAVPEFCKEHVVKFDDADDGRSYLTPVAICTLMDQAIQYHKEIETEEEIPPEPTPAELSLFERLGAPGTVTLLCSQVLR